MDRAQISGLLNRAQHTIGLAEQANHLLRLLKAPSAVRIGDKGTLGIDTYLIPARNITWPDNLYVTVFLEGLNTQATLTDFIASTAVLPRLVSTINEGQGGMFRRLFNPAKVQAGDQAAFDLMVKLDENAEATRVVSRILEGAGTAHTRQQQGVAVLPGIHGTGERYIEHAQHLLATALDLTHPSFDTWDGATLAQARRVVQRYAQDPNSEYRLKAEAEKLLGSINELRVQILLEQLPIDALRTVTDHRLRFGSLESIRVVTVADVLKTHTSILTTVQGIGQQTAQRMKAAAETLKQEALSRQHTSTIGEEPTTPAMRLINVLARFDQTEAITPEERARRSRVIDYVEHIPPSIDPYIVINPATEDFNHFTDDLRWVDANPNLFHPQTITTPPADIWDDYLTRPAHYQGLLSTLLGRDIEGADELLDATTLQKIRELTLNKTHITDLHLRGYQSFGARFAIIQKKVLLGDDMGLGKTVQAISTAAHLSATEKDFRTLVVVPASVIVNWTRECTRFTNLPVFIAHGDNKQQAINAWSETNGIAVCTYDGVRAMDIPSPGLVIADEAHMIKNPATKRTQALRRLIDAAPYALLMTGTPLENKVEEFVNLVRYIQPDLITRGMAKMQAENFRERIAPAYLRRNQADVLDELPERTDSIDWIDLTAEDRSAYDEQVRQGSWMGMRRSAMLSPAPRRASAKMQRILELLDEAEEHGRKALIFTYFLDVLDELENHLGERVVGRISGEVPATKRQELVDALSQSKPGSALIAQITAGGVGLNIQSASLCIICEPQVKPTIEQQAVARVHRMGQTATVQVHRLIGDETADERMLVILAGKTHIFDVYARLSETAEIPDAVDITESQLAARVIDEERARLGITDK
ncbi:DEAD/DEAH box helicase [Corynebacterium crudilactis]|uniref:DEAD/DEAH box helicase n=2 Tax=Corynebacterium crudilactis TaxID=1652495 RepID=A0A172QXA4_9CORY|nr:DEAD/DEAH box helicase [Corynebacterium crudilactis]ANE05337.1 DEAD/DEAH box helicase [Corynebacterium crudilactis]